MKKYGQITILEESGGDARRRVRPIFIWMMVGLAVLSCVVALIEARSPSRGRASMRTVSSSFHEIRVPDYIRSKSEVKTTSKREVKAMSARYVADQPGAVVLADYGASLREAGWMPRRTFGGGRRLGVSYCRGNLQASVEVLGAASPSSVEYEFSVSWSGVSERECP
jgi:hypothetical protein